MSQDPIGIASGRERGTPDLDVISAVERLTVEDLDRLINTLTLARTAL